jgi:hypothetical protein
VPPLRELQQHLAAHLFEEEAADITPWVCADGIAPASRLAVYRNNLHEGFIRTLALEFPVVHRLVGADYFRQLARAFLQRHPSRSGDLHHVGAPFASFLRAQFAGSEFRYLPDVAALEWACQECLVAEESEALDPSTLGEVPLEHYGNLRFSLRSACRLLDSPFPILRIWEANQPESAASELISLDSAPDLLLLCRTTGRLRLHRLEPGHYYLLASFAAGLSLAEALAASLACDPQFDLGVALRRSIEHRALARMTFHRPRSIP